MDDMEKLTPRIFVSYSPKDRSVVEPVAKLLRATTVEVLDGFFPAKQCRLRLEASIDDSDIFIVFWSRSAARGGGEVGRACDRAVLSKEIVPVCLDETPLPSNLEGFGELEFPDAPDSMQPPSKDQIYAASILQRIFRLHFSTRLYLTMESWLTIGGGNRHEDENSHIVLQNVCESGFDIRSTGDLVQ